MGKVVARFEKVSFEEFKKSWIDAEMFYYNEEQLKEIYDGIKLPQRSTQRSSGYDFFFPGESQLIIKNGRSEVIPTGIRCVFLEDGYDLCIYPRSGLGFKYRMRLDNTVGIIDNDYFEALNEGHIKIKISYDRDSIDAITINPGDKFAQGIFREFFLAEGDDEVEKGNREGGMGSTGK
jgi:dUTP pyrophosphatase